MPGAPTRQPSAHEGDQHRGGRHRQHDLIGAHPAQGHQQHGGRERERHTQQPARYHPGPPRRALAQHQEESGGPEHDARDRRHRSEEPAPRCFRDVVPRNVLRNSHQRIPRNPLPRHGLPNKIARNLDAEVRQHCGGNICVHHQPGTASRGRGENAGFLAGSVEDHRSEGGETLLRVQLPCVRRQHHHRPFVAGQPLQHAPQQAVGALYRALARGARGAGGHQLNVLLDPGGLAQLQHDQVRGRGNPAKGGNEGSHIGRPPVRQGGILRQQSRSNAAELDQPLLVHGHADDLAVYSLGGVGIPDAGHPEAGAPKRAAEEAEPERMKGLGVVTQELTDAQVQDDVVSGGPSGVRFECLARRDSILLLRVLEGVALDIRRPPGGWTGSARSGANSQIATPCPAGSAHRHHPDRAVFRQPAHHRSLHIIGQQVVPGHPVEDRDNELPVGPPGGAASHRRQPADTHQDRTSLPHSSSPPPSISSRRRSAYTASVCSNMRRTSNSAAARRRARSPISSASSGC